MDREQTKRTIGAQSDDRYGFFDHEDLKCPARNRFSTGGPGPSDVG
jgi:hypothetical protein